MHLQRFNRPMEYILDAGTEEGILPCGLGARDTLRFEACLPLYGQELTKDISPLEANIGFVVKLKKNKISMVNLYCLNKKRTVYKGRVLESK